MENIQGKFKKIHRELFFLRNHLKRSGAPAKDLIIVYCAFIRPVLEYASPVWHFSLTQSLSDQIEHIQKRALKIAFPEDSYSTSLEMANLPTLYQRREHQCQTLYKSIHQQSDSKLRKLLPIASSHMQVQFKKSTNLPTV